MLFPNLHLQVIHSVRYMLLVIGWQEKLTSAIPEVLLWKTYWVPGAIGLGQLDKSESNSRSRSG